MRFSLFEILTAIAVLILVAGVARLAYVLLRKEEHTREKFAFAALTIFSGMAASVLSALGDKQTVLGEISDLFRAARGLSPQSEPPRTADHILMFFVLGLVAYFILRLYENWPGAISVRQFEKTRYHETAPLILEGFREAMRIVKREPPPPIMVRSERDDLHSALDPPQGSLAWHVQVRELLLLRSQSYEFDPVLGWHDQERCWIGRNIKTKTVVALKCVENLPSEDALGQFVNYVQQLREISSDRLHIEHIVASRQESSVREVLLGGIKVRIETERSLFDGLVDFSDYFAAVRRKIETVTLPDSSVTLADVYVSPKCRNEGFEGKVDFEEYIDEWLAESGQRQLALLGEYGQGKSTAAQMLAYRIITSETIGARVPILIELRGKSPRNMSTEDILGAWAYPYRIDPQAVMKLLIGGRILVILEGFDEMALVGDAQARLAHFETLWKFCYPQAKILITGRPNFFLDDREMRAALGIAKATASGPYCEALKLVPFDNSQIERALRKATEDTRNGILALAESDTKFREIVSRGSLLYVVSQLWARDSLSRFTGRITSAFVMDLFIEHSYRRQAAKGYGAPQFMVLNESERKYFTAGIAARMGALRLPNQITRDEFARAVKRLYEVIPESVTTKDEGLPRKRDKPLRERLKDQEDPVQDVANDLRATGILVADDTKSAALRFAHKSFLEYLVARVYANYILRRELEAMNSIVVITPLQPHHIQASQECTAFFAEIMIGSVSSTQAQIAAIPGQGAKLLFEVIVLNRRAAGPFTRVLAWIALRDLGSRAAAIVAQRAVGRASTVTFLFRLFSVRSIMFSIVFILPLALMSSVIRKHHYWLEGGILLWLMGCLSADRLIGILRDAVELWFVTSVLAGMKRSDIASVIGTGSVIAVAKLLKVYEKLSSD